MIRATLERDGRTVADPVAFHPCTLEGTTLDPSFLALSVRFVVCPLTIVVITIPLGFLTRPEQTRRQVRSQVLACVNESPMERHKNGPVPVPGLELAHVDSAPFLV